MSVNAMADYVHPILGTFRRIELRNHAGERFCRLTKIGATEIPGLGLSVDSFEISLNDSDEPTGEILQDLIDIIQWPRERLAEIEDKLFEYYAENREHWLADPEDLLAEPQVVPSNQ